MRLQIHGQIPGAPESQLGLLADCHARIRRFTDMGVRLAMHAEAPAVERAEAAAAVHRYFTVAFPLHAEDEELLLVPALRSAAGPELEVLLGVLEPEHRVLDVLLSGLVPLWAELIQNPEKWEAHRAQLGQLSQELAVRISAHLEFEERYIFPVAERCLGAEGLAQLRTGIAHRREAAR